MDEIKASPRESTPLERVRQRIEGIAGRLHSEIDMLETRWRSLLPEAEMTSDPSPSAVAPGSSETVRHLDAMADLLDRACDRILGVTHRSEV